MVTIVGSTPSAVGQDRLLLVSGVAKPSSTWKVALVSRGAPSWPTAELSAACHSHRSNPVYLLERLLSLTEDAPHSAGHFPLSRNLGW